MEAAGGTAYSAVGRDAVLDQAVRAIAGGGAVVLEGSAGIGKTAVWRALVDHLRATGWRVLTAAPTETEAQLPFLALADLLRPVAAGVAALPSPQRLAAEAVLATSSAEVVDERAIAAATLSLLELAATQPPDRLVIAIDDVPWLDPHSERALRFALRRLAPCPALLLTVRTEPGRDGPPPVPLGLDAAPTGAPVTAISLGPLGVGALHHVVRARVGRTLSRPLLARIAREAGGNPLIVIEMARAVLRRPHPPSPSEDLPVVSSLQQLLADSLARLSEPTRAAVRLAALLAVPTLADLAGAGVAPDAFDEAEEAGLLTVTATGVTFAHPAYASAVRQSIPAGVRRRLHRTLAGVVRDPEERALQLARCAVGPDATAASELAQAAQRLRARGAPASAAGLFEQAAALMPPDQAALRDRWRLDALRCRYDSGDYAAAAPAAAALAAGLSGELQVEALLLSSMIQWAMDDMTSAVAAAEEALAAAPAGSALAGRLHAHLSVFHDAPGPARRHATAAVELLSSDDPEDRDLLIGAHLQLFFNELRAGEPPRLELLDRALALEQGEPSRLAGTVPAVWWKGIDDHDRARARLEEMYARAVARGDEPLQHEVLTHLGETELLAGRFAAAADHIAAARLLGEQLGSGLVAETWLAATLDALRGELATAQAAVDAGLRRADEYDDPWCRRIYLQLGGFVALSAGRMDAAATAYGLLVAASAESGLVESIALRFEPDWIEACVGAGDIDTAQAALARLAERHARFPRPWTTLGLARSRVLLAGTSGIDASSELDELARARALVPDDVLPLDRARCLLIAGLAHRRARRKREAQVALETAATEFTAIGAVAFADRARAELRRVGVRRVAATELSPTELRVATLAASGQTNRAIADALFISPKTVEANLVRIYRKLGIANRAQLGAALDASRG